MCKCFLLLACWFCQNGARRVHVSIEKLRSISGPDGAPMLSGINVSSQSLAEEKQSTVGGNSSKSPSDSPDVERVLVLFCMMAIGYVLRDRFSAMESGSVQKLLLLFLVPATLFGGMSKEKVEAGHVGYLAIGVVLLSARAFSSFLVSYAVFGRSCSLKLAKLRRTAMFEISTLATALTVLPFVSEFVGPEFVGLGGMVDLPMKMCNLIVMPLLLKMFNGEQSSLAGEPQDRQLVAGIVQALKDPITMSLILGIVMSVITDCQGLKALGFTGNAVATLAQAQTPILFLLIGLKLNVQSSTPLICVVLLLANQGVLLICVQALLNALSPEENITKFIILFAQGAPSLLGLGVITSAVNSGLDGYSPDFAFDLVGVAFPISSVFQCIVGFVGTSYAHLVGTVGFVLLATAGLLRVIFNRHFQDASGEISVDNSVTGA